MNGNSNTFVLKSGKKTKHFSPNEVAYIVCDCCICDLHFVDGSHFTCTKPLVYFEDVLPADSFCRINHHIIINLQQVSEIISSGSRKHDVRMKNEDLLPVSHRKWMHLKRKIFREWRSYAEKCRTYRKNHYTYQIDWHARWNAQKTAISLPP